MTSAAHAFVALVLACSSTACATPTPAPPAPAATEAERWVQDADYALDVLRARHPDLFHAESAARFRAELAPLHVRGSTLEREDVFFALLRMVALAHDAHTCLDDWNEIRDPRLPVTFEAWTDGLWIASVGEQARELFGLRVVTLAGRTPEELRNALAPLVPHENERVLANGVAVLASFPRALHHVGVIDDVAHVRLELEDRDGRRRVADLEARPAAEIGSWFFVAPSGWRAPLYRRAPDEAWWWRPLFDGSTLYLQYNRCLRREEHPFDETATEILARLERGGIERVWIDLRLNGGGDSGVLRPLIDGLGKLGFRGERVVVSIGTHTFSSGMLNAFQLQRELDALLVGEPTSQKPDCFGELRSVVLPNTGWKLDFSTKRFRLFGDDRPWLAPDFAIEQRFVDLLDGRDAVLEWLRRRPCVVD